LESGKTPRVGKVKFRDVVRFNFFDWVENADLLVPERFVESAQTKAFDWPAVRLSDQISAEDHKAPSPHTNRFPCLKIRCHGQSYWQQSLSVIVNFFKLYSTEGKPYIHGGARTQNRYETEDSGSGQARCPVSPCGPRCH
jgi:hypothetical protein